MKTSVVLAYMAGLLSIIAIGAWLVIENHPWFATFVILIGASLSLKYSKEDE